MDMFSQHDAERAIYLEYDGTKNATGVPITFLNKHNPEQFEIVGADFQFIERLQRFYVSGNRKYARIVIRRQP